MLIQCIDIEKGKIVQKVQGDKTKIIWPKSVIEQANEFAKHGFKVDMIDLDAPKGESSNHDLMKSACGIGHVRVGGGLRTAEDGQKFIEAGAKGVIYSSKAYDLEKEDLNYSFLESLAALGRDKIIIATDILNGKIAVKGWKVVTNIDIFKILPKLENYCAEILCHYINNEGTMRGTNISLYKRIRDCTNLEITAAGGISTLEEVEKLNEINVNSVIGMAFYSGKIKLEDMLKYK